MKDENARMQAKKIQNCLEKMHRQLLAQVLNELNKVKVSMGQYNFLYLLDDEGACPMTKAARCLYVTTSAVTAMTDGLISKGMVKRKRGARDRRIVEISITDKGRKVVDKIRRHVEGFYIPILNSLGKKNSRELVKLQMEMCRIMGCAKK